MTTSEFFISWIPFSLWRFSKHLIIRYLSNLPWAVELIKRLYVLKVVCFKIKALCSIECSDAWRFLFVIDVVLNNSSIPKLFLLIRFGFGFGFGFELLVGKIMALVFNSRPTFYISKLRFFCFMGIDLPFIHPLE